jgi:hypothetical protein
MSLNNRIDSIKISQIYYCVVFFARNEKHIKEMALET